MLRVLLLDLAIEIFLHGEIIHVFPEELPIHLAIALPVEVKAEIVDEPPQVDIVLRLHDLREIGNLISCIVLI